MKIEMLPAVVAIGPARGLPAGVLGGCVPAACLHYQVAAKCSLLLMLLVAFDATVAAQTLSQRLKTGSVEQLAKDARQQGDAIAGAILYTRQDLSCTRCHDAGAANPVGPDLRNLGDDATDVYLVESLLEPSKVIRKGFESVRVLTDTGRVIVGQIMEQGHEHVVLRESSGDLRQVKLASSEIEQISPSQISTMPDNLVDQLANRQQFLDLVRYLMELAVTGKTYPAHERSAGGKPIRPELQGIVLLKDFNCAACHLDDVTKARLADKQAPDLLWSVGRIDPDFLQRFIADPLTIKPGTTMPDLMSGLSPNERKTAALEITHFLMSLVDRTFTRQPVDSQAARRGRELFHSAGCVACHSPRDENERELLASTSVPMGPIQDKYSRDTLVSFLKDPLQSRPSGRMPGMKLDHWEAVDVASYLLRSGDQQATSQSFVLDSVLAEKGKLRFSQLGCRQCHHVDTSDIKPSSVALSSVRVDRGCLSDQRGTWPKFGLSVSQRSAIQATLRRETSEISQGEQIGIALTAFRCVNCHQRGELGGVAAERNPHFQTADPNLGPQGRIPPTLDHVGAKLKPKWMRQVLVGGRSIRPYVLTRMPQYGTDNIAHLVELFQQADRQPSVRFASFEDQKETRKIGGELVGTGGLNCIVCHTFQLKKAANMSAVDLTEMAERLQKTWFYHYMRDPQRLSPNTIMPSFWPGGRAMRRDILDGDADQQIEVLWQYLLDGRQARAPRGLIREPMELLAADEAVMLRRAYPGIGKRGIGVGFPSQVNLAYDAEQMRLALIWQGKFADPGGVWRSQGHGRVRPLGEKPIEFAPGPDLDDANTPWVVDEGRPPNHQFKGYSLDETMRPRFKYQFQGMQVEDYSLDVIDSSSKRAYLRRKIRINSDASRDNLTFRAATGKSIKRITSGVFLVDGVLHVHLDDLHTAQVIDDQELQQLVIPLIVPQGNTELTLEYRW